MSKTTYMNISEFAKLSGIKRENLIFYDSIDLLKPIYRTENNYRCYSQHQLKTAFIIMSLRSVDISLKEIKTYTEQRTPEKMLTLFEAQEHHLQDEITKLKRRKAMMKLQREMVLETMNLDTSKIHIIERAEEAIFLGEDIEEGVSDDKATIAFYDYAEEHGMELSNPFGAVVSKESLCTDGALNKVNRFYLKLSHKHKDKKLAGTYAVGFFHGDYGSNVEQLYEQMLSFIHAQKLSICGNAYEEYPLYEITTKDPNQYLIKIEIMVTSK